jgi:hypothetical protein
MKLAPIAALGLLALAAISSALQCGVGSSLTSCTMADAPSSNYICYPCAITSVGTFAGFCDNSVTTGVASCTGRKAYILAIYTDCSW